MLTFIEGNCIVSGDSCSFYGTDTPCYDGHTTCSFLFLLILVCKRRFNSWQLGLGVWRE